VVAEAIGEGKSNATFRIRREGLDAVLRRPPPGPIAPKTHDVVREARVTDALATTAVPVPAVLGVCDDDKVLGVPFALTRHLDGVAVSASFPPALAGPANVRGAGATVADTLAAIHSVDVEQVGLAGLGRPEGYLERQLTLYLRLWETYKTRELALIGDVARLLKDTLPEPGLTTLVHGDYRLGNIMFERTRPAALAVLDWEVATVADPRVDLGYLCACWTEIGDDPDGPWQPDPATRAPGCMSRAEIVARYEETSGTTVADLEWYVALALWRGAVFMEGNYARVRAGTVDDPVLLAWGDRIPAVAELAWASARALA
jgi:aminoglycoside phosphotransferase (APT) family kinase protein